jgi:hypothetical protein
MKSKPLLFKEQYLKRTVIQSNRNIVSVFSLCCKHVYCQCCYIRKSSHLKKFSLLFPVILYPCLSFRFLIRLLSYILASLVPFSSFFVLTVSFVENVRRETVHTNCTDAYDCHRSRRSINLPVRSGTTTGTEVLAYRGFYSSLPLHIINSWSSWDSQVV